MEKPFTVEELGELEALQIKGGNECQCTDETDYINLNLNSALC